jgi:hypothetical protein
VAWKQNLFGRISGLSADIRALNFGPDASYTSRCHIAPSDVELTNTFDVKLLNLTIGIFDATHLLDSGTKTLNISEQFKS